MTPEEFEQARRELEAAREEHRAFMASAQREMRETMQAAAREMRQAMQTAGAEMRAAQAEFRAEMQRARREGQDVPPGSRSGRNRRTSWWDPFLRAQPNPRPPRRPRKGPGGETEPVEPRPKPTPLQGGAEAPIE